MNRLIMMSGLSASGKSTVAESLQKEVYPGSIRVNKDLLRKMLHFGEYNWKNEKTVSSLETAIAREVLLAGGDVIVDDTNLHDHHEQKWTQLARECGALFIKVTQTTAWEECVERDSKRADSVGADVIKKQAMELDLVDEKFVICDLDGTLCDITDRRHFVSGKDDKSWEKFFANIPGDKLREDVAETVKDLNAKGFKVVYLTGRPEEYKAQTVEWLIRMGMDFNFTLIMRRKGDKRDDVTVKREMLNKYFPDRTRICGVIDDRPSVLRMWKEELGEDLVLDVGDQVEF